MRTGKDVVFCKAAIADGLALAADAAEALASAKMVKTASSGDDLHLYIDPRLAGKFKINLHLMEENDRAAEGGVKTALRKDGAPEFQEKTIFFPSKRTRDPNYMCFVVLQEADKKMFVVSAYMMETYLGQYVFRSNYLFRKGSGSAAQRCFDRVVARLGDLRQDFVEGDRIQSELPYLMRRALQGEHGEVEPKENAIANYLNPANAPQTTSIGSENIPYIPSTRGIEEDVVE